MATILRQLDRLLIGGLLLAAVVIGAGFHAGARAGEKSPAPESAASVEQPTTEPCPDGVARKETVRKTVETASTLCGAAATAVPRE